MDFFEKAYHGTPPWDIGRAQREFVQLEDSGDIHGSILDVGCGKGDNVLFFAARGHEVWGTDSVPSVIAIARERAETRNLAATFLVQDSLQLASIGRSFDTIIDSGFFHTLSDPERPVYAENLHAVLRSEGSYFMLAFSELETGGYGPRRVTQKEIQEVFFSGWRINWIRPAVFESRTRLEGSRAWLSSITRI